MHDASIILDRCIAVGVGAASRKLHRINDGFVVVIIFPFCIQIAPDRIMAIVATFETASMAAFALAILSIAMQQTIVFYCQCATRCWTPPQRCIVLRRDEKLSTKSKYNWSMTQIAYLYEAVCYQASIFVPNIFIDDHLHDKIIINNYATFAGRARNGLGSPFICDFQSQVLTPTILTILVITA